MRETFKLYVTNELQKYNSILANNSLTDEDKAQVENTINYLNEIMSKLEEANDNDAVEELKTSINELQDSLTAIKEKIAQNKNNEEENKIETEMTENYLKTQNSVADFLGAVKEARNGAEFAKAWRNKLAENSISIVEGSEYAYLPDTVRGKIQDLWSKKAGWLTSLKTVNAKAYTCRYNVSDQNAEASRAKGWQKGKTKTEQTIEFAAKKIVPQFIYKIQTIDYQTIFEDDGSLLNYLLDELVSQIIYEEKRAILIGDGRDVASDDKITSIEPIYKGEGAVTDNYTTIVNRTATSFMLDDLRKLVGEVRREEDEEVILFLAKSAEVEAYRVAASATSTPLYMEDDQLAAQVRASRIIITEMLDIEGITALAMIPSKYVMIGQNILNPTMFKDHDVWTNTDIYRYECIVGGGIEGLKSTAILLPAEEESEPNDDQING